jgi:ABC-2 type transport system permease protein
VRDAASDTHVNMINPFQTRFAAVFQNEVRLNSRRVAPYVLMLFSIFNACLWSLGQGASYYGKELLAKYGRLWAPNSDYYIAHHFGGYALGIFGLPLFAAVIMAEPVRRDFRLEIDALIFSKPVSRAQYLLGKFVGSFFVLVCCQASFAATLISLQVFHPAQTVVLPFRLLPYFKHFIMEVVITYVLFAAVYFTIGTLTRNPKIVYGLAIAYYPLMFSYGIFFLKGLPPRWRVLLSPLMLREVEIQPWGRSPEWVDQLVVSYTPIMIANRALVILAAAVCLMIVCLRFRVTEPPAKPENFSWLNLSAGSEVVYFDPPILQTTPGHTASDLGSVRIEQAEAKETALPSVSSSNTGLRANLAKLAAALDVEFRLLRAERSLVVITPLAVFFSTLELAFYKVVPEGSYSATYAAGTAKTLLFFLLGMTVFYVVESMQRDREVRIEPVLWAQPTPNSVLLLSKFLATFLLMLSVIAITGLSAIAIQLLRGHAPIELYPYLLTYSVILIPSIVFMAGVSILLNVLLREKYLAYVVIVGVGAGLFYLYSQGHNHWLYNPALYQLWNYPDLTGAGSNPSIILIQRLYCVAIATLCLSLAHVFFPRKSTKGFQVGGRLSAAAWASLTAVVSLIVALITSLFITSKAR